MNINYRRGFQRLYIAASILWVAATIAVAIHERPINNYPDIFDQIDPKAQSFFDFVAGVAPTHGTAPPPVVLGPSDFEEAKRDQQVSASGWLFADASYWIPHVAMVVLPPPIGYVVLFIAAPWIVAGFKAEKGTQS
jgi:hypothetical protein